MNDEIHINVVVTLPDDWAAKAQQAKLAFLAWEALTAGLKGTEVASNTLYLEKPKQRRRRRAGRPRLTVAEPPTAA